MKLQDIKPLPTQHDNESLWEGVTLAPARLAGLVFGDDRIRVGFEAEWFDKGLILEIPTDVEDLKAHPDYDAKHFDMLVQEFLDENWDQEWDRDVAEEEVWRENKIEILKAMGLDVSTPMSKSYMDALVQDFEKNTGIKIKDYCIGYNCSDKGRYDGYFLETDGFGPELISPPQGIKETLEDLQKVLAWIDARPDAITTKEKGLHFGVSVKGAKKGDVDLLKLCLFLGEKYILDQFERYSNDMTAPHMPHLIARIQKSLEREKSEYGDIDLNYLMQGPGVVDELTGILNKVFGKDKFRSFNALTLGKEDPYVEFRIPGNVGYEKRFNEIRALVLRIAYVMKLATDPKMEREEYMKKLYKLFDSVKDAINAKDGEAA